jgi:hypothetical protein
MYGKSLLNIKENEEYNDAQLEQFGHLLYTYKSTNDMLVFHFPNKYHSFYESTIRHWDNRWDLTGISNYTTDSLCYNPNKIYEKIDNLCLKGYREIKIGGAHKKLELVGVSITPNEKYKDLETLIKYIKTNKVGKTTGTSGSKTKREHLKLKEEVPNSLSKDEKGQTYIGVDQLNKISSE